LPANLPRVVGDQKTLRQIMINLLSNSIKYSNAGGEVLISAAMGDSGALTLRVKDTGIGMSEAEVEEVLKPYGRIENAARQRQGTGLGLPLTKSLVEANRGRLSISSKTGEGTLVEILFPGPRVLAE
jgi:signal transduction histidine kinase